MNELDSIAATFRTSEPVFKITVRGSYLEFTVKNPYKPAKTNDPVQALIASGWSEYLDIDSKRFVGNANLRSTYNLMFNTVEEVAVNCSPLKNPKQSRLYKWLNNHSPVYNDSLSTGIIALYRYITKHGIERTRNNADPYAKNVLAVLELMREKYEVQPNPNK